ncbi:MAG: hypothetical protein L3K11_00840 [Thermoplasmata archaeon]|nr:hypothetical protein [Thermoplasmata archaeon]
MTGSRAPRTPVSYLQILQVMVASELVEELGESTRHAADLLGVAPSAVSQYLSGKRRGRELEPFDRSEEARRLARSVAHRLVAMRPAEPGERLRILFDGARALVELTEGVHPGTAPGVAPGKAPSGERTREMLWWSRARVRAEQRAVAQSMRLAQKARDELTRAVFRQIASDSLRHAEIVASLGPYLSRGISRAPATGITRADVEGLIRDERRAEARPEPVLAREVGGTLALLLESIAADERKHDSLLSGLLESGFASRASEGARPARRTRPRKPAHDRPRRAVASRGER